MGNNNSSKIDCSAVSIVNILFSKPDSQIIPYIRKDDNTPLLDGYISVYKSKNIINNNIIGNINVQVKGEIQTDPVFKEKITYPIDTNLLRISIINLGLVFFVVRLEASSFSPSQVYYTLLTIDKITELLDEIKEQKQKSISLCQYTSLKKFTMECLNFIDNKYFLIFQLNKINFEKTNKYVVQINQEALEDPWLKSIYYDGERICNKHPLITIYDKLINTNKLIIFVGEPRLGKSYEMLSLYLSLNKNNNVITRFYGLSQYQGGNLEKDLSLNDEYLPYNIILDAYDEISPFHKRKFNTELLRIANKYSESKFVISTREMSKDNIPHIGENTEVYLISITIDDLLASDDESEEKRKILSLESDQLKELFLIPIYRPIINEIKEDESIYYTLINYAIKQNRAKISTKYGKNALVQDDELINELTAISLEMQSNNIYFVEKTEQENLLFETDFFKTYDDQFYFFSNKTYQDYFTALYYSKKTLEEITPFFFVREKLSVAVIDIFIIFYDLVKHNNKELYDELYNKLESISIEAFLITDLSLMPDDSRYDYFIRILENRNKNKKYIYYSPSRPEFGPLKNISNMAKKMQELLPVTKRKDAFYNLKEKIIKYLEAPDADTLITFTNSIILLNKYSDIIWEKDDLETLKNLSCEIIKFFLYNEIAKPIKPLLTYHSVIIWYRDYSWTEKWSINEWENFFKYILKNNNTLNSVISSNIEFSFKLDVFNCFYETKEIQTLLKPILFYSIEKNIKKSEGTMAFIPTEISDNDVYPEININYYLERFYGILEKIKISINIILEILKYSINKKPEYDYMRIKNPITILENKLYDKIDQLTTEQYPLFSEYFFHKDKLIKMHKFFEITKLKNFDNLKIYLLKKIYYEKTKISQWVLESLLANLLNLSDINKAKEQINIINNIYNNKECISIYKGIIYEINRDTQHILYNTEKIKNDYQILFADYIEAEKRHNELKITIKDGIDIMNNNELYLIIKKDALLDELSKAVDYLNNLDNLTEDKSFIEKVHSLESESILNNLEYFTGNKINLPPIFSNTVLFIIRYFIGINYKKNNIDKIKILDYTKSLQKEPFYIFFYWIYIKQHAGDSLKLVFNQINENQEIKIKILNSMKIDIPERFKNKTINDFNDINETHWVSPFLYNIKYLLNNIVPEYINKDNALKLIACGNPYDEHAMMSYSVNLAWFEDIFGTMISRSEIVKYGLENIDLLQNTLPRLQILNYFLNYYETVNDNNLNICIKEYIIKKTGEMFLEENKYVDPDEYPPISDFWSKCEENNIDALFPKFTIDMILSTIQINDKDINYKYRKIIIEYCIQASTKSQKLRIINEIKNDLINIGLTLEQKLVVDYFLASMGDEERILHIINGYLNGDSINTLNIFTMYKFGCLYKTETLLNKYIDLLFYSTHTPDEKYYIRRENLLYLARNGIGQHISAENFGIFEEKIKTYISELQNENKFTGFYEDFLVQIEQYVYSQKNIKTYL